MPTKQLARRKPNRVRITDIDDRELGPLATKSSRSSVSQDTPIISQLTDAIFRAVACSGRDIQFFSDGLGDMIVTASSGSHIGGTSRAGGETWFFVTRIPATLSTSIMTRLKIMADMSIADRHKMMFGKVKMRLPQEGVSKGTFRLKFRAVYIPRGERSGQFFLSIQD